MVIRIIENTPTKTAVTKGESPVEPKKDNNSAPVAKPAPMTALMMIKTISVIRPPCV